MEMSPQQEEERRAEDEEEAVDVEEEVDESGNPGGNDEGNEDTTTSQTEIHEELQAIGGPFVGLSSWSTTNSVRCYYTQSCLSVNFSRACKPFHIQYVTKERVTGFYWIVTPQDDNNVG